MHDHIMNGSMVLRIVNTVKMLISRNELLVLLAAMILDGLRVKQTRELVDWRGSIDGTMTAR
jgi:hypothetical protein